MGLDDGWGPYGMWVRPLLYVARGEIDSARRALRQVLDPPGDLLCEALWAIVGRAAIDADDAGTMRRVRARLAPAASESTAQCGLIDVGPVQVYLDELAEGLSGRSSP